MAEFENNTRGSALKRPVYLAPALAEIVGGNHLPRTEVTKLMWDYIKAHNLQDSANKRMIRCDRKLMKIFKVETLSMFLMNKILSKFMSQEPTLNWPDLTQEDVAQAEIEMKANSEIKKAKRKERKEKEKAKKKRRGEKGSRGGNPKALTQPQLLSADLQSLVGVQYLSRPHCVSKIWDYIKARNLQDPDNKRKIICDMVLRRVFGVDEFTMFDLNKLLTQHLIRVNVEDLPEDVRMAYESL